MLAQIIIPATILLFALLTFYRPAYSLYLIILLPIFGEFGRLTVPILNRDLIAADLFLPIFTTTFFLKQILHQNFTHLFKTKTELFFILFSLTAIFSNLLNFPNFTFSENLESNLYLFRLIQYFLLIPITIKLIKTNQTTPKTLLTFLISTSVIIATAGFIQLQILPDLKEFAQKGYDPHINRLVSTWLDPNYIGGYLSIITLIIIGQFFDQPKLSTKILLIIAGIINSTAIFLTYSRSAYVAFAIGLFAIGIIKSRKLIIILTIIFLIGLSISDRARERTAELIQSINSIILNSNENPDPTARLRIENFESTLTLINQKPILGHGYNTLKPTRINQGQVKKFDDHAASGSDSSLLGILATTGIIGLIFFLLHHLTLIKKTLPTPNQKPLTNFTTPTSTKTSTTKTALFATTLTLFTHAIFVNSLLFPYILIPYYILQSIPHSKPNQSNN